MNTKQSRQIIAGTITENLFVTPYCCAVLALLYWLALQFGWQAPSNWLIGPGLVICLVFAAQHWILESRLLLAGSAVAYQIVKTLFGDGLVGLVGADFLAVTDLFALSVFAGILSRVALVASGWLLPDSIGNGINRASNATGEFIETRLAAFASRRLNSSRGKGG